MQTTLPVPLAPTTAAQRSAGSCRRRLPRPPLHRLTDILHHRLLHALPDSLNIPDLVVVFSVFFRRALSKPCRGMAERGGLATQPRLRPSVRSSESRCAESCPSSPPTAQFPGARARSLATLRCLKSRSRTTVTERSSTIRRGIVVFNRTRTKLCCANVERTM
jgi:hypothetical protein